MEAMRRDIPVARPLLGDEEALEVQRVLRSGWITQGPEVAAFESEFASYVGANHACAVANCTAALHLALLAVGVGPGDEVITASHSFIATGNAIRYCGGTPVFIDIEPGGSFNLDPARIAEAIGDKTKAILVVHQLGMPCDLAAILPLAWRHALPVIEDAACAVGSEICWQGRWDKIGKPHGDIACFSFHPRKVLTTGDGGMLTTNRREFDRKFRLWRQHGMSVSDRQRHDSKSVVFEAYVDLGFNYRLTDVQAAIGRVQLRRLRALVAERRVLAARYQDLLRTVPSIRGPVEPEWARSNWQSFAVTLPDEADQRRVMQWMADHGIVTRRGVMCMHREMAYLPAVWRVVRDAASAHSGCSGLERSERAQDRSIILPLLPGMSAAEQSWVIENLNHALEHHATAERKLAR